MLDFHGHRIHFPLQSRFSVRFAAIVPCQSSLRFINYSLQTPLHQSHGPKVGVCFCGVCFFFGGGDAFLLGGQLGGSSILRVTFCEERKHRKKKEGGEGVTTL